MKRNIVLIGYRCSGKTSVGKILAREWGRDFSDTDALIEKNAGCSVEEIVSRYGWDHFRATERRLIEDVTRKENLVIASGGGAVMDQRNVRNLKRNGLIVWLRGSAKVLHARMDEEQKAGKIRPSLTGADPREEIQDVLRLRDPAYGAAADIVVDTSGLSVEEVAYTIRKALIEIQDKQNNGGKFLWASFPSDHIR
jgi:shikimate kinase